MVMKRSSLTIWNTAVLLTAASFCDLLPQTLHADFQTYIKSVYSLPLTLDPIQMNDTASLLVGNLLYDGLLRFSPTLELEPSLAKRWTTSQDGKVLTFYLDEQAKFHDGSPITAFDVVESLKRALGQESKVRKLYDCIVGVEDDKQASQNQKLGLYAKDLKTVEIRLKHPFPPFLSVLAGATAKVLPKAIFNNADFFKKPIGSGPFKWGEFNTHQKTINFFAFEQYHQGKPSIDTLQLAQDNETQAIEKAKRGKLHDLANWPLTAENSVFQYGQKISAPVAATWIIGLNTRKKPFDNLHTRQNFRDDLDTEAFRRTFYPDAWPAYGYVPYGLPGAQKNLKIRTKVKFNPSTQKIEIVIPSELSQSAQMKNFLEAQFKTKGWNVVVQSIAWEKLMEGYIQKAHQAFLVAMNMDYPDAEFLLKNFESQNSDNFSGLQSKTLDALLRKGRTESDRSVRQTLYQKAIDHVDDMAVTIPLFHPRANYWVSHCVEGFKPNILSDVYIDYRKIHIKKNCQMREKK